MSAAAEKDQESRPAASDDFVIRNFQKDDVNTFIRLGEWVLGRSKYADVVTLDVPKVVHLFTNILTNPDYFGVYAETGDGKPVGTVLGFMQEYYMSRERFASDMGVMLLPEYRNDSPKLLGTMISRFEAWAISRGAKEIMISTSTGAHGHRYPKYIESLGYEMVGFNAKRRVS